MAATMLAPVVQPVILLVLLSELRFFRFVYLGELKVLSNYSCILFGYLMIFFLDFIVSFVGYGGMLVFFGVL